jgi:O-methyltransferase involved in polyketide biosynthesis
MKNKFTPQLDGIPETLLISARARYLETKRPNGIIHDPITVDILDSIDYDFSGKKEVSMGSQIGTSIRTEILDEQTLIFLQKNPEGIVVNLGCGLDTRYHRLDNSKITWFDLDVPETIEIRKNFFAETEHFHFIAKSVLDFSWMDGIPKDKPTLFIAEGLLMYFTQSDVKKILSAIANQFSKAEFLIEGMSPFIANNSKRHVDVKKYNATFKWGIKSGKEINNWNIGLSFINEWYYFDRHKERASLPFRILSLFSAFRKSMKIMHLKSSNNDNNKPN